MLFEFSGPSRLLKLAIGYSLDSMGLNNILVIFCEFGNTYIRLSAWVFLSKQVLQKVLPTTQSMMSLTGLICVFY